MTLHFPMSERTHNPNQASAAIGTQTKTSKVTRMVQTHLAGHPATSRLGINNPTHFVLHGINVDPQVALSQNSAWAKQPYITAIVASVAVAALGLAAYAGYRHFVPTATPVVIDPVFSWSTAAVPAALIGLTATGLTAKNINSVIKNTKLGGIKSDTWGKIALKSLTVGAVAGATSLFGIRHSPKIAWHSLSLSMKVGSGVVASSCIALSVIALLCGKKTNNSSSSLTPAPQGSAPETPKEELVSTAS